MHACRVIKGLFHEHGASLSEVVRLAFLVREHIVKVSPFIERAVQCICPSCDDVCCTAGHGYFSFEDIVYLNALGLIPPQSHFGRPDSEPCQFHSAKGCSLMRDVRPSGCNWYFCPPLLEYMEKRPRYIGFDSTMTTLAHTWMSMIETFSIAVCKSHESVTRT